MHARLKLKIAKLKPTKYYKKSRQIFCCLKRNNMSKLNATDTKSSKEVKRQSLSWKLNSSRDTRLQRCAVGTNTNASSQRSAQRIAFFPFVYVYVCIVFNKREAYSHKVARTQATCFHRISNYTSIKRIRAHKKARFSQFD